MDAQQRAQEQEDCIPVAIRRTLGAAQLRDSGNGRLVVCCGSPFHWKARHKVIARRFSEHADLVNLMVDYLEAAVRMNQPTRHPRHDNWMGTTRGAYRV